VTRNRKTIKISYNGKEDGKLDNAFIYCLDGFGFRKSIERYDYLDKEKTLVFERKLPRNTSSIPTVAADTPDFPF